MNMLNLISIEGKKEQKAENGVVIEDKASMSTATIATDNNSGFFIEMNNIPVIKQINSTDLNFDLIQDFNASCNSHQQSQTSNNTVNANSGSYILLNNQSFNFNHISNLNLVAAPNANHQFINPNNK